MSNFNYRELIGIYAYISGETFFKIDEQFKRRLQAFMYILQYVGYAGSDYGFSKLSKKRNNRYYSICLNDDIDQLRDLRDPDYSLKEHRKRDFEFLREIWKDIKDAPAATNIIECVASLIDIAQNTTILSYDKFRSLIKDYSYPEDVVDYALQFAMNVTRIKPEQLIPLALPTSHDIIIKNQTQYPVFFKEYLSQYEIPETKMWYWFSTPAYLEGKELLKSVAHGS